MIKHISSVLLVLLLIMPSAKASDLNVVDEKYQITNTDYYTVKIGEYWGIIDGDGNYLVEAIYDSIDTYFCHGRLRFCLDGLYGYFDESFNIIIKAQFLQAMGFYDDEKPAIAQVTSEEGSFYIDIDGNQVSPVEDLIYIQARSGKLVAYAKTDQQTYDTKCCVYDLSERKQITDYIWDTAVAAPNGSLYLGAKENDNWSYSLMDNEGNVTRSPVTSKIYKVDMDGYIVTVQPFTVTYKNDYYDHESTGEINRYGLIAPDGTLILENVVECGTGLYSSEPLVFVNDRSIIQTGSTEYKTYTDNSRYGFSGNGKFGVIDRSGKYVSNSDFDSIVYQGGWRFLGKRDEKYYVIGMDGSEKEASVDAYMRISSWAEAEVGKAIEQELVPQILKGYYTFNITRHEFCLLAVALHEKLAGEITIDENTAFCDTDDEFILKAASIGIVNGYDDGTFRPYREITREEAATMLGRLYTQFEALPEYIGDEYTDEINISNWAIEYVRGVREAGIMHGVEIENSNKTTHYFYPKSSYTIEQAILTMLRLYTVLNSATN